MIVIQIFKGLFLAFGQLWQGLWRKSGKKVKWSLAVIVTVLVGAFLAKRVHDSFSSQPPDWLRRQELTSPPLPRGSGIQFQQLLDQGQRYAAQHQVPLGAVRLWEVQPDLTNVVLWSSDAFVNPGFSPIRNFERSFRLELRRFVGYYTGDGKPLEFTVKHTPTRPKDLLLTVHLPAPVAPGATQNVFRLERQPDRAKLSKDGKYQLGLGRLPPVTLAVHLWAVRLPAGAKLLRCVPEKGVTIQTNEIVQLSWVNARIETSAPPISVVFAASK